MYFKQIEDYVKSSNKNETKRFGFKEIKNVMFNIKYVWLPQSILWISMNYDYVIAFFGVFEIIFFV